MSDYDLVLTGRVVRTDRVIDTAMSPFVTAWWSASAKAPPPQASERHDFGNAFVLPGAIDSQVHSRSQKRAGGFHLVDARGRGRRRHNHRRHAL